MIENYQSFIKIFLTKNQHNSKSKVKSNNLKVKLPKEPLTNNSKLNVIKIFKISLKIKKLNDILHILSLTASNNF